MIILGINAYHGDAAAAIIRDGLLVAAVEEERFNRIKHCAGFPAESVRYCLAAAGISIEAVEHIGISRDPSAHLHKKILFAAGRAAKQMAGGRRQKTEGSEVGVGVLAGGNTIGTSALPTKGEGNGKGTGIFRQVKDRLGNAA